MNVARTQPVTLKQSSNFGNLVEEMKKKTSPNAIKSEAGLRAALNSPFDLWTLQTSGLKPRNDQIGMRHSS